MSRWHNYYLEGLNWLVSNVEIDGHDVAAVDETLAGVPFEPGRPSCVIAHTVKGKGISFMEDEKKWHHGVPSDEQYKLAMKELEQKMGELQV